MCVSFAQTRLARVFHVSRVCIFIQLINQQTQKLVISDDIHHSERARTFAENAMMIYLRVCVWLCVQWYHWSPVHTHSTTHSDNATQHTHTHLHGEVFHYCYPQQKQHEQRKWAHTLRNLCGNEYFISSPNRERSHTHRHVRYSGSYRFAQRNKS